MSLLRIAVPNKGSLAQSASEILRESGYRQRDDAKQLTLTDAENGVEFFYLRPRDIALYVGEGTLDVGVTGRDLLRDSGAKADEVLLAGLRPEPVPVRRPGGALHRPRRAGRHPDRHVVRRGGERVPRGARHRGRGGPPRRRGRDLDPARRGRRRRRRRRDRQHAAARPGSRSSARRSWSPRRCSITRSGDVPSGFEIFRRRVEGVLVARTYVMMDYDIEQARVTDAVALTPGIEGPTIAPLHREGWVAVRAMVPARRRPAADGRALRARCAGDPAHGHPCLPTLSPGCPTCPTCRAPGGRSGRGSSASRSRSRWSRWSRVGVVQLRRGDPQPGSPASSAARWSSSG